MLGSVSEADDAVQEAWLRLSRADASEIENLGGWLTTVVARVCLNMLRSRDTRARSRWTASTCPTRSSAPRTTSTPSTRRCWPTRVGLALLVVLETLAPAERLAFVLHDMFARAVRRDRADGRPLPGRGAPAREPRAAPRAGRGARSPTDDLPAQREVVDAFFAAARDGDFDALVAVLDPDVVLRADGGALRPGTRSSVRGAQAVAAQAMLFAHLAPYVRPALVNGAAGVVVAPRGRPFSVMGFTVVGGRIVAIDALADPERLRAARPDACSTTEAAVCAKPTVSQR